MKRYLNLTFFAAIVAMMGLTSCSSEENIAQSDLPEPINFSVGLGKMNVTRAVAGSQDATQAVTLTTVDEAWSATGGETIGIYTQDADGLVYLKSYTVSGTGGTATENISPTSTASTGKFYWGATTDCHRFVAYSYGDGTTITPTQQAIPATFSFSVNADQSTNVTGVGVNKEFLFTQGSLNHGTNGTAAKTITLGHQLCLLEITVNTAKDPDPSTAANKLGLTIGESSIATSGTFNVPTYTAPSPKADELAAVFGTWTPGTQNGSVIPRVKSIKSGTDGNYSVVYSAVVIPQDFTGKTMFVISFDGATYKYTGAAQDDLSNANGVGKKVTYTVTLENSEINVTQASIQAWGSGGSKTATANLE